MVAVMSPPEDQSESDAREMNHIPRQTTDIFVAQARLDLAEYQNTDPGARSIIKAKMRELIEELDNSLHRANMPACDQEFIFEIGELVGHHVLWRTKKRHTWN